MWAEQIKPGFEVKGIYVVKEKKLLPRRSPPGCYYLAITFGDRTGQVEGRVWENAEEVNAIFRQGDIVAVKARAEEYNKEVQLRVTSIAKYTGDIDPKRFIPSVQTDINELKKRLYSMFNSVKHPFLHALLCLIFTDQDFINIFYHIPAAKKYHHALIGGLLVHSLNVAAAADRIAQVYSQVNRDLLVTGALLHDIGKVEEYRCNSTIEYTDAGRLLGHIVLGVQLLDNYISRIPDFPEDLHLKLTHMIVSHHGRYEWQSPKRPKFLEAAILHQLDMLDVQIDMFGSAASNREDEDSNWSVWIKELGRYVYFG